LSGGLPEEERQTTEIDDSQQEELLIAIQATDAAYHFYEQPEKDVGVYRRSEIKRGALLWDKPHRLTPHRDYAIKVA